MLRYPVLVTLFLMLVLSTNCVWGLEITEVVITTAVIDREPVDNVDVFPVRNGTLYCFTHVTGADEPTTLYHLWYRGERLMSRVGLPVNSPDWRTWSAKHFQEDLPGEWRVEIQTEEGDLLQQIVFQLR